MIPLITRLFANWRMALGGITGLLLVVLTGWLGHLRAENASLASHNQQLQQQAATMQHQFTVYRTKAQTALNALAAENTAAAQRHHLAAQLQKEIAHAQPQDDGAVAPVLHHLLGQLRQPPAHNID